MLENCVYIPIYTDSSTGNSVIQIQYTENAIFTPLARISVSSIASKSVLIYSECGTRTSPNGFYRSVQSISAGDH